MPTMTGNRFVAELLKNEGVTHFFYVPVLFFGAIKEMTRLGVTPVVAHSEKAAAYMADGYARASGKLGICGSQQIGGSNLAAGLRDAFMARSPVLALTGGPTPETRHRNLYQDIDDRAAFAAHAKASLVLDKAERTPDILRQAMRLAVTGVPRPVHLQIAGFWGATLVPEIEADSKGSDIPVKTPALRIGADEALVRRAADRIRNAARPILIAGGGTMVSGAQKALQALAEKAGIGIATSMSGKNATREDNPLNVGVVGDYSRESANIAVSEADLVVFVGSTTGSMVTRNWTVPGPQTPVIHIDIDSEQLGRNYPDTLPLWGDAKTVLKQLLAYDLAADRSEWLDRLQYLRRQWREFASDSASMAAPMRPERLCQDLSRLLPEDAILVSDTGHSAGWFARHIEFRSPRQTGLRAAGSLGWSFPAAMGAKCAAPDRTVVCLTGDGGLFYHLTEMETAVRYGINTITVVINNNAFNQEMFLWDNDPAFANNWRFGDTDFANLARGFGAEGYAVRTPEEFLDAFNAALNSGHPALIDVRTDVQAVVPPSWGPGAGTPYAGAVGAGHS